MHPPSYFNNTTTTVKLFSSLKLYQNWTSEDALNALICSCRDFEHYSSNDARFFACSPCLPRLLRYSQYWRWCRVLVPGDRCLILVVGFLDMHAAGGDQKCCLHEGVGIITDQDSPSAEGWEVMRWRGYLCLEWKCDELKLELNITLDVMQYYPRIDERCQQ